MEKDFTELARPLNPAQAREIPQSRKPDWIRIRPPSGDNYLRLKDLLRKQNLHTVCEEARCPNLTECWASGTATLMLGGDVCTRGCRFCAVKTARRPPALDPLEPVKVAESLGTLGLKYVVLTSVDRDDLEDQMSGHFSETIRQIKKRLPELLVEALVPDFRGDVTCVKRVVDSGLEVYAHNIETVKRLQYRVRDPRAGYLQSLGTLKAAKSIAVRTLYTKSAIMLGLGETFAEIEEALEDLRAVGVDVVTLGQYLRPTLNHLPVEKFYTPEEFLEVENLARDKGFLYVAAGPMVRSSYKAAELFLKGRLQEEQRANGIQST